MDTKKHEIYMANEAPTQGDPTRPIFHMLTLGLRWVCGASCWVCGDCVGSMRLFRYQHVGIGNANLSYWGPYPTRRPDTNGFTLQWNIGFSQIAKCADSTQLTLPEISKGYESSYRTPEGVNKVKITCPTFSLHHPQRVR